MLNKNNIKIALLEISPQNKAILEFYFNSAGKDLYSVVDQDKANAFIIDYDQPGAKEHVTQIHAETNSPIIILSIKEQDIPSTVWVEKPLSADALGKAAVTVEEMMAKSEVESTVEEIQAVIENQTEEIAAEESVENLTVNEEETVQPSLDEIEEFVEVELQSKEEVKENNALEAGLTIAGVGALVSATLDADD